MALSVETESHIYRALRTASGAAAHIVALGFTIFVAVLARPGSTTHTPQPVGIGVAGFFLLQLHEASSSHSRSLLLAPRAYVSGSLSFSVPSLSPQFSFLMTEALLVFSPESSLLRSLSRKGRARCHWVLQLLALLCALLGLGLVILHKEQLGKAHLATWHGRAGLLAVLWAGLQCSGGVGLLYPKLLPRWPLAKLKLYHATSGLVGYLLGSASLLLGMCSLWFTATVTSGVWYLAVLCPVVTSLVIMNQVSNAYLYRKRIQP
ncbi:transmembrane reductase CYB561D2 isoform 2-T2 [Megaptera novaeangliae]